MVHKFHTYDFRPIDGPTTCSLANIPNEYRSTLSLNYPFGAILYWDFYRFVVHKVIKSKCILTEAKKVYFSTKLQVSKSTYSKSMVVVLHSNSYDQFLIKQSVYNIVLLP